MSDDRKRRITPITTSQDVGKAVERIREAELMAGNEAVAKLAGHLGDLARATETIAAQSTEQTKIQERTAQTLELASNTLSGITKQQLEMQKQMQEGAVRAATHEQALMAGHERINERLDTREEIAKAVAGKEKDSLSAKALGWAAENFMAIAVVLLALAVVFGQVLREAPTENIGAVTGKGQPPGAPAQP